MRAIAVTVILLLSFCSFSSVQAEPSNSCKQCRDQQQACAKNYGSKAWAAYVAPIQVKTPSADLDNMVNLHNPRQSYITKNWSRYLSLYQLGQIGRAHV